MFSNMENMHKEMMKGFGGSLMGRDMFKDDPFFSRGFGGDMFERADKMFEDMRREMGAGMMDMPRPGQLGKGQFMQQSIKKQTKLDQNGKQVSEVYQTKAHGAVGGGNRIVDR